MMCSIKKQTAVYSRLFNNHYASTADLSIIDDHNMGHNAGCALGDLVPRAWRAATAALGGWGQLLIRLPLLIQLLLHCPAVGGQPSCIPFHRLCRNIGQCLSTLNAVCNMQLRQTICARSAMLTADV